MSKRVEAAVKIYLALLRKRKRTKATLADLVRLKRQMTFEELTAFNARIV